jgi:ribose-phosphate pyrophosphokinase
MDTPDRIKRWLLACPYQRQAGCRPSYAAGANRIITLDLHAGQIQGFFNIPVDNLFAAPVLLEYIKNNFDDNVVIVSPDAGGVERARAFAKRLNASHAIIDKRREAPNVAKAMAVIGDVSGKKVIILDDMTDYRRNIDRGCGSHRGKRCKRGSRLLYTSCAFRAGGSTNQGFGIKKPCRHRYDSIKSQNS